MLKATQVMIVIFNGNKTVWAFQDIYLVGDYEFLMNLTFFPASLSFDANYLHLLNGNNGDCYLDLSCLSFVLPENHLFL